MSHVSADLEYFKCDVCGTYFHKDIFVPHRRECTGLHSTEMKKSEIKALHDGLSRDTRQLVTVREREATETSNRAPVTASPAARTNVLVSTDEMERRQADQVRTRLAQQQYEKENEKFRELADPSKRAELMAFLNS